MAHSVLGDFQRKARNEKPGDQVLWGKNKLSPKATPERCGESAKDKIQRGRRNGYGKAAPWKSPKPDFSTELANPANCAGFALSHSRDHGGSSVTFPMSRRSAPRLHS